MNKSILFVILIVTGIAACSQDNPTLIKKIERDLKQGQTSISEILTKQEYMHLHSEPSFRNVIKSHSKESFIRLTNNNEPGKRITIKGTIKDRSGNAQSEVVIYVYQTSDKGWYGQNEPHFLIEGGDHGHARIFGYLKSDNKGKFSFETIMPRGYPDSDLPAHIHIQLWAADGEPLPAPAELLFDDDRRLTPERRKRALTDGFLISKNTGSGLPVYEYTLVTY